MAPPRPRPLPLTTITAASSSSSSSSSSGTALLQTLGLEVRGVGREVEIWAVQ